MDRDQVGERIHRAPCSERTSAALPAAAFMACRNSPTAFSGFFQMQVNDPHIVVTRGSDPNIPREIILRPKRQTDPYGKPHSANHSDWSFFECPLHTGGHR